MTKPRRRRGAALLVAITLIAFAAALLVATTSLSRATFRAARQYSATLAAEGESERALASVAAAWPASANALAVGNSLSYTVPSSVAGIGQMPVLTRVRIERVAHDRFVVAVETNVGAGNFEGARRRLAMILERAPASDSTAPPVAPSRLSRWPVFELF